MENGTNKKKIPEMPYNHAISFSPLFDGKLVEVKQLGMRLFIAQVTL